MTYEELLDKVREEKIDLYTNYIGNFKGLYIDDTITLNTNLENDAEKKCVLAEELGHHYKTCGDILDQSKIENKKQERIARGWAYDNMIGIIGLINAYKNGCKNKYEISEYLNVSEQFLKDAIAYYSEKYGPFYQIDNYAIYFDPLSVIEIWE